MDYIKIDLMNNKYYFQIDILKCTAIISVIVIHSIPAELLETSYSIFHFWQAVPIFLVIMGVNLYNSYSKLNYTTLGQYYSKNNLLHRCERVLPVFFIVFIASWVIGSIKGNAYFGWKTLFGVLPIPAPGNIFLSIILQMLFVAPLLVYFYRKNPVWCIVTCFILNLLFEIAAPHIFNVGDKYFYYCFFVRTLAIIAMGLYLGEALYKLKLQQIFKNEYIQLGVVVSFLYLLAATTLGKNIPWFIEDLGTENIIALFYPLLIVAIVLNIRMEQFKDGVIFHLFGLIGKASYHILLVQMVYFGLRYGSYATQMPLMKAIIVNVVITVGIGIVFYYIEQYGKKIVRGIIENSNSTRIRLA